MKSISELKKLIKAENQNDFAGVDADELRSWKVEIPDDRDDLLTDHPLENAIELQATKKISKYFPGELAYEYIHVIVEVPPGN